MLNAVNSATRYNVNPPPGATECRHWVQRYAATKVGRRQAVPSLIRAEGVLGKFELAAVFRELRFLGSP
jgi:hypothetical protein